MSEFLRLFLATTLGATVSFGTTFYFQRHKEGLEQQQATAANERELRRALRLVSDEVLDNLATIAVAREAAIWWALPPTDLAIDLWKKWQSTLADLLDDDSTWEALAGAYSETIDLNLKLEMFRRGQKFPNSLASYIAHEEVFNEGWDPTHAGAISPQWDDTLMRVETVLEWANYAIAPLLSPGIEPPEPENAPSRMKSEKAVLEFD